jgi:hypothetical protein
MPIRIFENQKGKLVLRDDLLQGKKVADGGVVYFPGIRPGWGMDKFSGNAGTNLQFKANESSPSN